jgi:hypothetical protein
MTDSETRAYMVELIMDDTGFEEDEASALVGRLINEIPALRLAEKCDKNLDYRLAIIEDVTLYVGTKAAKYAPVVEVADD